MAGSHIAKSARRSLICGFVVIGLAGCSGFDGVELNGGIFELTGLSGIGKKQAERKLPVRGPLVMPPSTDLRTPDQLAGQTTDQQAWPVDPDKRRIALAKQRAAAEKKKCEQGIFAKGAGNSPEDFERMTGQSSNSCDSVLNKIINNNLPGPGTDDSNPN